MEGGGSPQPKEAQEVPLEGRKRRAVIRELAARHRRACKKQKTAMADQVQELCSYNRQCGPEPFAAAKGSPDLEGRVLPSTGSASPRSTPWMLKEP